MRTKEQMRQDWIAQREAKGMFTEALREKYEQSEEASGFERLELMLFTISAQMDMMLELLTMEDDNE